MCMCVYVRPCVYTYIVYNNDVLDGNSQFEYIQYLIP